MSIKFVNLKRQYLEDRKEIIKSFDKISKSGNFILGKDLEIFEKIGVDVVVQGGAIFG